MGGGDWSRAAGGRVWRVMWLVAAVVACVAVSSEVRAQEATGTLLEALSERMEGIQPAREDFPRPGEQPRGADVAGAIGDSFRLLSMQHGLRIAIESKTRRELGGPFFKDYTSSLRMPRTWGDTDSWLVNYVGHPGQGAASAWVWLHNDGRADAERLGRSRSYWTSRARALAWSAAYSTQFEMGPYSEASIGNVGLKPETVGWTDYVITPLGGIALVIVEDALDQHVLRKLERTTSSQALRALYRSIITPNRAIANVAGGRWPWHRRDRGLDELWSRQQRYGRAALQKAATENATAETVTTGAPVPPESPPPAPVAAEQVADREDDRN